MVGICRRLRMLTPDGILAVRRQKEGTQLRKEELRSSAPILHHNGADADSNVSSAGKWFL